MTRSRKNAYWTTEALPGSDSGEGPSGASRLSTLAVVAASGQQASRDTRSEASPPQHDELGNLATAALGGSPTALRTLLTTLVPQLLRVVRRVLGPGHPDLEDVTYQAAYAVLDSLPRFRREGTVRHYACRVAAFTRFFTGSLHGTLFRVSMSTTAMSAMALGAMRPRSSLRSPFEPPRVALVNTSRALPLKQLQSAVLLM